MNLIESLQRRKILSEGIEDPAILKCIFLAGGPGSGKSFIARDLFNIPRDFPLSSYGLKLINSDNEFEFLLKKADISLDLSKLSPEVFNKLTKGPDSIRNKAKELTNKKLNLYRKSKLGLIIDGTGDSIDSIQFKKSIMEKHGYDCFMIFVNTSLDVALERNFKRKRKLPEELVKQIWNNCQKNIGHFQSIFGNNFRVVDNSNSKSDHAFVIRSIVSFIQEPIKNYIGKKWMENYYKLQNFSQQNIPSKLPDEDEEEIDTDFDIKHEPIRRSKK
jgi:tRNA uridine 5-carbamoylmethylation protein Kti12